MQGSQYILGAIALFVAAIALGAGDAGPAAKQPVPQDHPAKPQAALIQTSTTQEMAPPSPIPSPPDAVAVETEWRNWLARHDIGPATASLAYDGNIVSFDAGRTSNTNYPMASLSKAVTAICLDQLLTTTAHSWDTPLGALPELGSIGPTPHDGISDLPLEALVSHTSGFPKNVEAGQDAFRADTAYSQTAFARSALSDPSLAGVRGRYHYSNVNYALLGHVIEALSGENYADHCARTTLAPAGITNAGVAGRMWATEGFGGWQMSTEDYSRFVTQWFSPEQPWIRDPAAYPLDPSTGYGLGVARRDQDGTYVLNHYGKWNSDNPNRRHGTLFVATQNGAVFTATWQGAIDTHLYTELQETIAAQLR